MKFLKFSLFTLLMFFGIGELFRRDNMPDFFKIHQILAQTITEQKAEADQLLKKGIERLQENIDANQADATLKLFQKALSIYREIQDRRGEGQVLKNLGNFYYLLEDYSQALDYAQQTLTIAQKIEDLDLEARALNNQGLSYYSEENYPLAINSYQKGLGIAQKIANQELELLLSYNLANELYQQAWKIAQQLDSDAMNVQSKEIEGIKVPSVFRISLQGETDGESFSSLSGTLEIRPSSDGDPNPFLVSLYMNEANPDNLQIGSLFWQSYLPGHPKQQEYYSRISVANSQVRMEVNPSEGFRSDVMWFTHGSLGEQLGELDEELRQINEELRQLGIEPAEIPSQSERVEVPKRLGIVVKSGTLTFSIQGNQISGTIEASGISDEGQSSTYKAKFTGEMVTEKSGATAPNLTEEKDSVTNQIKNPSLTVSQSRLLTVASATKKRMTKTAKSDISKAEVTLSLTGTKEPQFQILKGARWGTERLQGMFSGANWIFFEDNTFVFAPPSTADIRDDLFPIFGNYSQVNNSWEFQGERQSSGAAASVDGIIRLEGDKAVLDAFYAVSAMDSQKIVRISQTLSQEKVQATYSPPKTEIEGIKVPSTFNISLQGETEAQTFDSLSGTLKIEPTLFPEDPNPFLVTLETNARESNGSISWLSSAPLSMGNSKIAVIDGQVRLNLAPSQGERTDIIWYTQPSGNANEASNIQGNQISGEIKASGNSWLWQSSTYVGKFTGEVELPPPSFKGVWEETAFGEIELRQEGEKVSGTYTGRGGGRIEGIAQGNRLDFTWKDPEKGKGWGFFRAVSGGRTLTGMWGTGNNKIDGNNFIAERSRASSSGQQNQFATEPSEDKQYLRDTGYNLVLQGRCEQALKFLEKALELYQKDRNNPKTSSLMRDGYLIDEVNILTRLSYCYFQLADYNNDQDNKDYNRLLANLRDVVAVRQTINQTEYLAIINRQQANSIQSGLANYIEFWRQRLTEDKDKIAALDKAQSFFQELIIHLVELGAEEEALLASEIARARAFADLLATQVSPKSTRPITANPPSIEQIQQIAKEQNATLVEYWVVEDKSIAQNKASKIYIWVIQPSGKIDFRSINFDSVDLKFADKSLNEIVNESRQHLLSAVTQTRQRPLVADTETQGNAVEPTFKPGDLVRIKKEPREWGIREVVSVYPESNSVEVRFVNDPEASLRKVSTSELERASSSIYFRLQKFHELLIKPIAELLPTNPETHVIFIPHKELFLLPFPALQDQQEQYLIDKHTILTSPAIQVLESTHKRRQHVPGEAQEILVVGNPSPMPKNLASIEGTKKEAEVVAQRLQTQAFIGEEATEKNIRQKLAQAKLIHLATHGQFDSENPLQGAIALAPSADGYDGLLTAEKILNLDYLLNAELVVLSACNTGRGKISGDGVIGLSRSWMVTGVPSMIISLWQVPDEEATPSLMDKFYEEYNKENSDKAQALRKAMLTTKAQYPDPKNWAAFILIGEAE